MVSIPLMPKATAVWLVENTSISFDQIAAFCHLHPLEVKAIADGDSAQGIKGLDPTLNGQLTRDQIDKAQGDANFKLTLNAATRHFAPKGKRAPRYTPVSKRQDRPNAILWLVRNHGELKNSQIIRLVRTTKSTIQSVRDRTHWNSANLTPTDPVTLGLCTQIELDREIARAKPAETEQGGSEPTTLSRILEPAKPAHSGSKSASIRESELDLDQVFAKLAGSDSKESPSDKDDEKNPGQDTPLPAHDENDRS